MELAISDMDVVKYIFPEFLERNMSLLSSSKAIALDGNLGEKLSNLLQKVSEYTSVL